jgi:hypothetical protein
MYISREMKECKAGQALCLKSAASSMEGCRSFSTMSCTQIILNEGDREEKEGRRRRSFLKTKQNIVHFCYTFFARYGRDKAALNIKQDIRHFI